MLPEIGAGSALLTVREVASKLRVTTATIYKMVARGELEHHRVASAIRIAANEVARYLARPGVNR